MFVKNVTCENYGPIHRFTIDFPTDRDGKPQLVVLVGQNGAGKSLLLSTIAESLIEIKRRAYSSLPEVPENEYYRLQKKDYIRAGQDYSYFKVAVSEGVATATLTEIVRSGPDVGFREKYPAAQFPHLQVGDAHFVDSGFNKSVTVPNELLEIIKKHVALYFPYFRYEPPAWLNPSAAVPQLDTRVNLYGTSTKSLIQSNIVHDIETWVLDLILDMELYEKRIVQLPAEAQVPGRYNVFLGYQGRNATTRDLLNQLLTTIYRARDSDVEHARIGISTKAHRTVSVIIKRRGAENEERVAPTFSHLSSGELMVFSIGASILRNHDHLNNAPAQSLADIRGVVLIDEVDLHLHIQLQKDVLPALFRLFPNVQFIVTTHSPFFLLGLSQAADIPHIIYRLPHGQRIVAEDFVEFQQAYDTFINRELQFKAAYDSVAGRLKAMERLLVITEGKTDWQHMKAALTRLQAGGEYGDLDFDFHEYEYDMGGTVLRSMCEQFSKVAQARRVVFIFDRDDPAITAEVDDPEAGYKTWGNNVYSFCLPVPTHRTQYQKIAIEFYYTDEELRTADPATDHRLVFSNEVIKVVESSVTSKGESRVTIRLRDVPVADEEPQKTVYDLDCEQIVNSVGQRVAHSKSVFAQHVLQGHDPFNNFSLNSFRVLFDKLRLILNA